ncbi:hypothetical protein BU14_0507s0003 [Porphyra umbilicalis]|uniref:USP domain-containing protein n=1 Tax=Porphyra umbilicalis TaxID=2786 RepID=A0A1X6NSX3_PORUM|nr:hypothetical protein BU14_0507s0003 [Porphyra umbilicalis]|eukprot:OSX71704.1 hypothetical protein BU14_0507s0003 [Porphyra umbilicalis]
MYAAWDAFDGLLQDPPPGAGAGAAAVSTKPPATGRRRQTLTAGGGTATAQDRYKADAVAAANREIRLANAAMNALSLGGVPHTLLPLLPPLPPVDVVPLPAYAGRSRAAGGRRAASDDPFTDVADAVGGGDGGSAATPPDATGLRAALFTVVDALRSGAEVPAAAINALRSEVRSKARSEVRSAVRGPGVGQPVARTDQEDPTEFFLALINALGAPYLPLDERLTITDSGCAVAPSSTDERVVTERVFVLPVPEQADPSRGAVHLRQLLTAAFGASAVADVRRVCARSGKEVLVRGKRITNLLPFYTPHEGGGGSRVADVGGPGFDKVALPLVLSRGRVGGVSKCRTRVTLPRLLSAAELVGDRGDEYSLALRSVVVHLGDAVEESSPGHYVAYVLWGDTWWRFNDLAAAERRVVKLPPGSTEEKKAVKQMETEGYLVFYELLAGQAAGAATATTSSSPSSSSSSATPPSPVARASAPGRLPAPTAPLPSALSWGHPVAAGASPLAAAPAPAPAAPAVGASPPALRATPRPCPVHDRLGGRRRSAVGPPPAPPATTERVEAAAWHAAYAAVDAADRVAAARREVADAEAAAAVAVADGADAAQALAASAATAKQEATDAAIAGELQQQDDYNAMVAESNQDTVDTEQC